MASTKISARLAASTLDGTEILPIVQNGLDRRVTAGEIVAMASAIIVTLPPYNAVGDDATSDQVAVAAAVAAAYSSGQGVYWPDGTYLTTATIPNFHDVRHRGPGIVQRGSDLFYPDPSLHPGVTNILYVATTGSDTNDGLSSSEPRLTTQATGNLLYTYAYGDVTWNIQYAAGTYTTANNSFNRAFPTPRSVQFLGASVSRGVQPTTIFQATGHGVGDYVSGIYFQNNIRAIVKHINVKSYRTNASPTANLLSIGIVVDSRSEVYTDNLWSDDCDHGVYVTNGSHLRMQAGRHGYNSINGAGVTLIRHCHGTIGYGGTLADVTGATGTAFIGGLRGVVLNEYSMAHTDYCYFDTQTGSGVLATISRIHSVSSTYLSCPVGIFGRMGANIGDTSNTFTTCTNDIVGFSDSRRSGVTPDDSTQVGPPIRNIDTGEYTTQSATPVTAYSYDFAAKELQLRETGFCLRIDGEVVGTANTKTITVSLGGTTILTAVIAATTTDYFIEVNLHTRTAASAAKVRSCIFQNGVLPVIAVATYAIDVTAAVTLLVEHSVTNTADRNDIEMVELEITH